MIAFWSPSQEKGKFTACLQGASIGTVVTWPIVGNLTEAIGWQYGFYVPAIILGVFTIIWYFLVYESPAKHPKIKIVERMYIESHQIGLTDIKVKGLL